MSLAKAKKIGGSIMVTIPKDVVKELKIYPDDEVIIEVKKPKKSYFGAFKGLSTFRKEDRMWNDE
jgi:bifunctional DNA-binding transcriptional regulator/antitoxin component of YhaV-PrlF toxin-antitoxin module